MREVKIKGVFDKDFKDVMKPDIIEGIAQVAEGLKGINLKGVETVNIDSNGRLRTKSTKMSLTAGTIDLKIDVELYDKPHVEVVDSEIVARFGKVNIGGKK